MMESNTFFFSKHQGTKLKIWIEKVNLIETANEIWIKKNKKKNKNKHIPSKGISTCSIMINSNGFFLIKSQSYNITYLHITVTSFK